MVNTTLYSGHERYTLQSLGADPDYGKIAHRDQLLPQMLRLSGNTATGRIPKQLRQDPALFFQGFAQLRGKVSNILKKDDVVAAADGATPAALAAPPAALAATPAAAPAALAAASPANGAAAAGTVSSAEHESKTKTLKARHGNFANHKYNL